MDLKNIGIASLIGFAGAEPSEFTAEICSRFDATAAELKAFRRVLADVIENIPPICFDTMNDAGQLDEALALVNPTEAQRCECGLGFAVGVTDGTLCKLCQAASDKRHGDEIPYQGAA